MRFLHTSDWHLGRTVRGRSRDTEHEAALQQILHYARENAVDCLLVAGDVFDTAAPPPEAERLAYQFFLELHGAGVPAVLIAGNHDHPRRFDALAPLLQTVRIHLRGEPRLPGEGGVIEIESGDGREQAVVAALPWVPERAAVDFLKLQSEPSAPLVAYADQVAQALDLFASSFRPDAVSIMMAHLLVEDSVVGPGGGERELHMAMNIYGVPRQRLPAAAQYVALGHVHKPQDVRKSPAAAYSGSLLQLDFGERDQEKFVNLVEAHSGRPAEVQRLPITAGRKLIDVGSPLHGIALNELAAWRDQVGDAWLRVFVDLDLPVGNLAALVRETLPNAVHIERTRPQIQEAATPEERQNLGPVELFSAFYQSPLGRGSEAAAPTLDLFRRLLTEERDGD